MRAEEVATVHDSTFDARGHDWLRDENEWGQPLLSMTCSKCHYQWLPTEWLSEIGACRG